MCVVSVCLVSVWCVWAGEAKTDLRRPRRARTSPGTHSEKSVLEAFSPFPVLDSLDRVENSVNYM